MQAERDNFNAALRHTIDTGDLATAVRLNAALIWFWITHDLETEGSHWAMEIHALTGGTAPDGLAEEYALCRLLSAAAIVLSDAIRPQDGDIGPQLADLGTALLGAVEEIPPDATHPALAIAGPLASLFTGDDTLVRERLAALADHPEPWVRAARHTFTGAIDINAGRPDTAQVELEAGLVGFREVGEHVGTTFSLSVLGELTLARGDYEKALQIFEEAYQSAWFQLSRDSTQTLLINRGRAKGWTGDLEGARADIEAGIAAAGRIGEFADQAAGYQELGELNRRSGDPATAREHYRTALRLLETKPWRPDAGLVHTTLLSRLGCLAEQGGDLEQATALHRDALRIAIGVPFMMNTVALAMVLNGAAALLQARGDAVRAAELLGTAHATMGLADQASPEVARTTAAARATLGDAEFQTAYDRGRKVTREQARGAAAGALTL
jgi:tetratricopeptide (TPR) repeat protein